MYCHFLSCFLCMLLWCVCSFSGESILSLNYYMLNAWLTSCFFSAAVVQLKTVISALSADESLSNTMVEKTGILQKVLVYVVSVISNFIDLHSYPEEKFPLNRSNMELFVTSSETSSETSTTAESLVSETMLLWHQKSVISVMEAGGLNWLVGKVCSFSFCLCLDLSSWTEINTSRRWTLKIYDSIEGCVITAVPADRILVLSFEVLCSMPLCDVSNPYSLNFGDIHPSRPHGYLSLL